MTQHLGILPITRLAIVPGNLWGGSSLSGTSFVVDDDSCCLWYTTNNANGAWCACIVYDYTGAVTRYQSPILVPNSPYLYINQCIPLGSGRFYLLLKNNYTGATVFSGVWRVGNMKLNNATPINLSGTGIAFTNPCYAYPGRFFFDKQKQLLAVGYYQNLGGGGGDVYASVYNAAAYDGSIILQSQGYVGTYNTNTGADAFASQIVLPQFDADQNYVSNGMNVSYSTSTPTLYGITPSVHAGNNTDCATPSGTVVNALSNFVIQTTIGTSNQGWLDSNVSNVFGVCGGIYDQNGAMFVSVNGSNYDGAFQENGNYMTGVNVALTSKHLFVFGRSSKDFNFIVAVAAYPTLSGPSSIFRSGFNMVNNARPISITGNYKS